MNLILVGLLFILFKYDYAFFSQNVEMTIMIDVLPDFVGYMLIWFGLEKASTANRWFKESHTIATGMMIVTFITLVSSLSFFLSPLLNSPDGQIFAGFFAIINLIVSHAGSLIFGFTMIFMFMFSSALGYSMQTQERGFSCGLMYVFSVAYTVLAVAYMVNQFINLPIPLDWISGGIGIVFIISSYFIMEKIEELK